jgi:hypothetical protein
MGSSASRPSSAQHPVCAPASSPGNTPSVQALDGGLPGSTPRCQCGGHCRGGHRQGNPCLSEVRSIPPPSGGFATCDSCRCSSPDCYKAKFRSGFCFSHAFKGLGDEFRVLRHFSDAVPLQQLMPRDIQAFLKAKPELGQDVALELIAAWIQDPTAIQSLLANRPRSAHYTGQDLLRSLKLVRGP